MSRKATKYQPANYLRRSLTFNYKPYRRPKTFRNTIRSMKYQMYEYDQSEDSEEMDEFDEEYDEEYDEEFDEEFDKEFDEEFDEEQSAEEFGEESEEEFQENDASDETEDKEVFEEFEASEDESKDESEEESDDKEESEEETYEKDESEEEFQENDASDATEDKEVFEEFEKSEDESKDESAEESDEKDESEEQSDDKEESGEDSSLSEEESEEESDDKEESEEESDESEDKEKFDEKEDFKEKASEKEEELKMALVNARSILKFINRGDGTLAELIQRNDLDVLLITETWLPTENLTNSDLRRILPPHYHIVDEPRFYGRGGGVAIVHHKSLVCKQVQFEFPSTFEFVAAALRQPGSEETVLILCIYRPPGGSVTELSKDFLSELNLLLSDVYARYENVIIGGDFNIWFDCPEMTVTQEFEGFMHDYGLVQHVWRSTHEGGHILDLVLSRPNVRITNVSVRSNRFSDHSTVLFRARF